MKIHGERHYLRRAVDHEGEALESYVTGIAPCKWSTNWDNFVPQIGGSAMAGKREKPEEIVSKLREVEVLQGQGMTIADAVRQIGVTQQTFY